MRAPDYERNPSLRPALNDNELQVGGSVGHVAARLNAVIVKAVNTPEMKETLVRQGFEAQGSTPEQFAAFIRNEIAQNARLAKFAGLKPE